MDEQIKAMNA